MSDLGGRPERRGAAEAAAVLEEALPLAKGLPDEEPRLRALGCILEGFAAFDPARAVALADEIKDNTERDSAILEIAVTVAARDPELALGLLRRYRSSELEDSEVERLAQALAIRSPEKAVELLGGIEDRFALYRAVAEVAEAAAAPHPEVALALARSIGEPLLRAEALRRVALGQLASRPEFAHTLGDEVVKTVQEVDDSDGRAHLLAEIARDLAPAGKEWAKEAADLGLAAARQVEDDRARDRALEAVAGALAHTYPDRAEAVARDISTPVERGHALAEIARVVAREDRGRALRLVDEVTRAAQGMPRETGISSSLEVQDAAVQALADRGPLEAFSFARAAAEWDDDVLPDLLPAAEAVVITDPEEVLAAAEQAPRPHVRRSFLLAYLAGAPGRELERVLALIEAMAEPRDPLRFHVVHSLVPVNPVRAQEISRTIGDPYWRVLALCELADGMLGPEE